MRTLFNRVDHYITTQEDRTAERPHIRRALRGNNYMEWAMKIGPRSNTTSDVTRSHETGNRPTVAIPYMAGLSEELARTYNIYGVNSI